MRSVCFLAFLVHMTCSAQLFQWTQLSSFPGTARDDASAFTIANTIFVGTGRELGFGLTADWYAFDMVGQEWTAIAPLPASGRQYCSTFSDGTYGYVFGGVDANGPMSELWRYDPELDAWEAMSSLPASGRYATVAFDNGMVCTGLLNGGIPTNECWQYDVPGNAWTPRASVPGEARHRASGSGSRVEIIGGADAEGNALSDGYTYDALVDEWSPITSLPAARIGADAVYDAGLDMTYVVGGASSSTEFHADAWVSTGTEWAAIASFSGGPRRGGVIAFGTGDSPSLRQVYYGTGVDATQRHADWWVYTNVVESIPERTATRVASYPYPSIGVVRIDLPFSSSATSFTVYDIAGSIHASGTLPSNGMLDLASLATGGYIIRITRDQHIFYCRSSIIRP